MKNTLPLLDFKPTQFAVGMLEVDEKFAELKGLKKKGLKALVRDNPIPVVISPHKEYFVVDRHHFICVAYQLDIKKLKFTVVADHSKSKMSFAQFWRWMHKSKNVYPYCQFGEGPRKALYLPNDIRGLADDPYRSLAWYVRKAGAFENSEKNFAEFQWANFFRKKGLLDKHGRRGLADAFTKAVRLAQSGSAKHLPGFGMLNLSEKKKLEKRTKKHSKKAEKRATGHAP